MRKNLEQFAWLWKDDWRVRYTQKMGEEEFSAYERKVYWFLFNLPINKPFNIDLDVDEQEHELFVKLGGQFIEDWGFKQKLDPSFHKREWYEFNCEYNTITHKKI